MDDVRHMRGDNRWDLSAIWARDEGLVLRFQTSATLDLATNIAHLQLTKTRSNFIGRMLFL